MEMSKTFSNQIKAEDSEVNPYAWTPDNKEFELKM